MRQEISERDLVALIEKIDQGPGALTASGVPVDQLLKYLSFALTVIELWKDKFGTKKPWLGRIGKILTFVRVIWKLFKIF